MLTGEDTDKALKLRQAWVTRWMSPVPKVTATHTARQAQTSDAETSDAETSDAEGRRDLLRATLHGSLPQ